MENSPILIILPGWMHNSKHWSKASLSLDSQSIDHEVVDLPGFGIEELPQSIESFADVSKWVTQRILEKYGNRPLILCGHSFGGRIAVSLQEKSELNIVGMLLIGSPNLYRPSFKVKVLKLLSGTPSWIKCIVPASIVSRLRSDDYQTVKDTQLGRIFAETIINDQASALSNISLPVSLVWGENDEQCPVHIAKEMEKIIPKETLKVLKNVGHDVHLEKPHLLATLIKKYVESFV